MDVDHQNVEEYNTDNIRLKMYGHIFNCQELGGNIEWQET